MTRILLLLIAALLHYVECQTCVNVLKGWEGTLYYPQMRANQQNRPFYTNGEDMKNNCVFGLSAPWPMEIQLTVGMIKIGPPTVLIRTYHPSTRKWEVLQSISGNIPMWIDLTATNASHLKIVVPKSAGSFFVDYKLNSCPPLPASMKVVACTKDRYYWSHCVMECGDEYYSTKIQENKFHVKCGRRRVNGKHEFTWIYTPPASEKLCVSKTAVLYQCFNETSNPDCPFTFNDLLYLMGERYQLPKREERPLPVASAGSRSLLVYQFLPPRVFNQLLVKACEKKKFCGRDPDTKDYVPVCGDLKRAKPKKVCMMCRHSESKPCDGSSGIID